MDSVYKGQYGVIGPPGTGKTTFLARQVAEIVDRVGERQDGGSPVLVSSLTRTAAAEVAGRDLPLPKAAVGTLHAHAFRSLDRPEIATGPAMADWNAFAPEWAVSEGVETDADDLTVDDLGGGALTRGDVVRSAYDLVRHRLTPEDVYTSDDFYLGDVSGSDIAAFAESFNAWKDRTGLFDFTDLISGALSTRPPLDPDVIVVDEVQDLSALEWELVRAWSDGRALIAVGDPWQSLYTWRGAHPELFEDIPRERLRILSQSYRVPTAIVATALAWMRGKIKVAADLVYHGRKGEDGAPVAGSIRFADRFTPSNVDPMLAEIADKLAEGRTVMVAASCGYMLAPLVARTRALGIPFANPWRTKRGDWNPLSSRGNTALDKISAMLAPATHGRLWTWKELATWIPYVRTSLKDGTRILSHGAKASLEDKAKRMPDELATSIEVAAMIVDPSLWKFVDSTRGKGRRPEIVEAAFEWLRPRLLDASAKSIDYARLILGGRFAGDAKKPRLYVGTVHSFKGAEADDVYLFTELPPKAREAFDAGRSEEIESVARMFYVGLTRARHSVTVCGTSSSAERSNRPMLRYIEHAAHVAGVA